MNDSEAEMEMEVGSGGYEHASPKQKRSLAQPGMRINASEVADDVASPRSMAGKSDATHISMWEQQVKVSDTSSTTHVPKEIEEDTENALGAMQMFRFFLKHALRDIQRRKCHFCLAFCSVFVVVLSTLVVNTVISKGPIIFLKLAQADVGEFDGVFYHGGGYHSDMNTWSNWNEMLNYTQVKELYADEYNLAPRFHDCGPSVVNYELKGPCIMLWDT